MRLRQNSLPSVVARNQLLIFLCPSFFSIPGPARGFLGISSCVRRPCFRSFLEKICIIIYGSLGCQGVQGAVYVARLGGRAEPPRPTERHVALSSLRLTPAEAQDELS